MTLPIRAQGPTAGPDSTMSGLAGDERSGLEGPAEQADLVPGGTGKAGVAGLQGAGRRGGDAAAGDLPEDGKAPAAFRTIGEVTRALKIAPHILRYWEEQFPMLRPLKRSGGRRYYRPEDMALLEDIHRLVHRQGYTLRGARKVLESQGRPAPQSAPSVPAPTLLQGLVALRGDLAALLES